jgi:hypothetical protein
VAFAKPEFPMTEDLTAAPAAEPKRYDPAKCEPFDLERALAGDPVCTVEGVPVTQLILFNAQNACFPLVGVMCGCVSAWAKDGCCMADRQSPKDLRMAPKKRTVFVNFYEEMEAYYHESTAEALATIRADVIAIAVPVEIPL